MVGTHGMKRKEHLLNKIYRRNTGRWGNRGIQRKTMFEDVEDLRDMGMRVWRWKAQDRSEWITI